MKNLSKVKEVLKDVVKEVAMESVDPIKSMLDEAAYRYSDSPATTNAGRVLRFISKFIKPSTIIKLFAHKLTNK
jgi:hypothetical protein